MEVSCCISGISLVWSTDISGILPWYLLYNISRCWLLDCLFFVVMRTSPESFTLVQSNLNARSVWYSAPGLCLSMPHPASVPALVVLRSFESASLAQLSRL